MILLLVLNCLFGLMLGVTGPEAVQKGNAIPLGPAISAGDITGNPDVDCLLFREYLKFHEDQIAEYVEKHQNVFNRCMLIMLRGNRCAYIKGWEYSINLKECEGNVINALRKGIAEGDKYEGVRTVGDVQQKFNTTHYGPNSTYGYTYQFFHNAKQLNSSHILNTGEILFATFDYYSHDYD
jgi:hypothetical protein